MKKQLFVLCPLLAAGTVGWARPSLAEPATSAATSPAADPRIKVILDRLRSVMHDVQSLTYDGESRIKMPDGRQFSVTKAKVTAEKGEKGWKYLVEGTSEFEGADGKPTKKGPPTTVKVAYDGTYVLGLQEKEKNVRKFMSIDPTTIRAEFNQSNGAGPVIWDLFNTTPMGGIDTATKIEFEPDANVGDISCDVFWGIPASTPGTPVVPFRAFLNKKNGLPAKMEYFKPAAARLPADKRGEPTMVLTLSDMKPSADSSNATFEFETPKGYSMSGSREVSKPGDTSPTPAPKPYSKTPTPTPTPGASAYKHPLAPSSEEALRVGNAAPPFKLKDFEGNEHSLEEFKGKVVVLDFWGSWCPPCRMAMPAVQKVYEKYKDSNVVVLGMNFEQNPKADPEKFKKDNGYTYKSLAKAETVAGPYKVGGWPTFYVIGRDGKIVWSGIGLESPPGGSTANNQAEVVGYLESNLSQAVDKALAQP